MHSSHSLKRAAIAALLIVLSACGEATAPIPLDVAGMQEDLDAAASASASPATLSLAGLGDEVDGTLAELGGGAASIDLPAAILSDPQALVRRRELRERVTTEASAVSVIPLAALGKTFVYDVDVDAYVASDLTGAPANGVRFILYAVDPVTWAVIEPLIQTGHVDLTRTITGTAATARVEVYATGIATTKVLDYAATVQGPLVAPTVLVQGFAKNGTDSLGFDMATTLTLATQTIAIDWAADLASRGVGTHVLLTLVGGANPYAVVNGRIAGPHGTVRIEGEIVEATGGTVTVKTNGEVFATIDLDSGDDPTPTVLGADGLPLTAEETTMLHVMLLWFLGVFALFENLLRPVQTLLDIAL